MELDEEIPGWTRIVECANFDDAFEGLGGDIAEETFINRVLQVGRAVIVSPTGTGKTYTLKRLLRSLDGSQTLGIYQSLQEVLPASGEFKPSVIRNLIQAIVMTHPQLDVLLMLDGLDEVRPSDAPMVLDEVERLARAYPRLGVVVADGMNRRSLPSKDWVVFTLTLVTSTLQSSHGVVVPLHGLYGLSSKLLADLTVDPGLVSMFGEHAFHELRVHPNGVFGLEPLVRRVGKSALRSAESSGLIFRRTHDRASYSHRLVQLRLAADWVAASPTRWTFDSLDVLTVHHTSYEPLALLVASLSPGERDGVVELIYDWDLYGCGYFVGISSLWDLGIPELWHVAVPLLLAERRFEIFESTRTQAEDCLRILRGGSNLLTALSLEELYDLARTEAAVRGPAVAAWAQLFNGEIDESGLLRLVAEGEPLAAWTCAAVLRRGLVSPTAVSALMLLVRHEDAVVRWRAAHVLGKAEHGRELVVPALAQLVANDEPEFVKFGALRSLVEIAARSGESDLRLLVRHAIQESSASVGVSVRLSTQLRRLLLISSSSSPAGWAEFTAPIIEQLLIHSSSVTAQDVWRRLSAEIRLRPHDGAN